MGHYSFSIYLIHWLVMSRVSAMAGDSVSAFLVCILASIIAGMILYYAVEAPLQRIRSAGLKRFSPMPAG